MWSCKRARTLYSSAQFRSCITLGSHTHALKDIRSYLITDNNESYMYQRQPLSTRALYLVLVVRVCAWAHCYNFINRVYLCHYCVNLCGLWVGMVPAFLPLLALFTHSSQRSNMCECRRKLWTRLVHAHMQLMGHAHGSTQINLRFSIKHKVIKMVIIFCTYIGCYLAWAYYEAIVMNARTYIMTE